MGVLDDADDGRFCVAPRNDRASARGGQRMLEHGAMEGAEYLAAGRIPVIADGLAESERVIPEALDGIGQLGGAVDFLVVYLRHVWSITNCGGLGEGDRRLGVGHPRLG